MSCKSKFSKSLDSDEHFLTRLHGQNEDNLFEVRYPDRQVETAPELIKWTDNVIVYSVTGVFSTTELTLIHGAFDYIASVSCFQVQNRTSEPKYINIWANRTGCWSSTDDRGISNINLQPGICTRTELILHQIVHSLRVHPSHPAEVDRSELLEIDFRENEHPSSEFYGVEIKDFGLRFQRIATTLSESDIGNLIAASCHTTTRTTTTTTDLPSTTQASTTTKRRVCPYPECIRNYGCYPHADKHKYYLCVMWTPQVMDCPDDLIFDPRNENCQSDEELAAACAK